MIENRKDLKEYIKEDLLYNNIKNNFFNKIFNLKCKYYINLRKLEYYTNCKKIIRRFFSMIKHKRLELKTGWFVSPNTCGKGLFIAHIGPVRLNNKVIVGEYCKIHTCVNIGEKNGTPKIGNNVYIGPGAKLFGSIKIADNIAIGANAVVNKSFLESGISIAGVPAKKISDKGNK